MRYFAGTLLAFSVCLLVALTIKGCDSGGNGIDHSPKGNPAVESASAEWTSVPDPQIGDTITARGEAEAHLSDGSTRAADSAYVFWGNSLVHRVEGQTAVETDIVIKSQGENALTLRAFASEKQDEATRIVAAGNPITGVEARWSSGPSVAGDTIVAEGTAEARRSDGSTDAADSAHVLWRGARERRVIKQKEIKVRVAKGKEGEGELTLRAFASVREDEATEIVNIDATPPVLTVSAEEGSDYGITRGTAKSNEPLSKLNIYLLNESRTDSIQVLSKENVQEAAFAADATAFYRPGDSARFSTYGEDMAGNVSHETMQGVVDGTDLEVKVLRASAAPGNGLVLQDATLTVIDGNEGTRQVQTETGTDGQALLENLAIGDTVKANDNPGEETVGDLYETNALVESKEDVETTLAMLPNVALQPGDETHEYSLDLLFQAQRFGETDQNPSVLAIPPHDIPPEYDGPTEEIYPMTFAINKNGKVLRGDHRQAIEEGVRSWNGPNRAYQHARVIEDTMKADWTIRIADDSEGVIREERAIEIGELPITFPPEPLQKETAHQAYHALELGPFVHLQSPRYVGNTNFGDDHFPAGATRTEVEFLHSLINLRTLYESQRNLEELFAPE